MAQGLKGKRGLSKGERQLLFCTQSQLCSGKAQSEEEAITICSLPKEPKPVKVGRVKKGQSCEKEVAKLSECMMNYFETNNLYKQILNINSVELVIRNALTECSCPK